jgi:para-nitrobenzyl esterase
VDGAVTRARGIPYARAERFTAPVAVADWSEPFDALLPAPASPQLASPALEEVLGSSLGDLPQSEDCQNLSVTLPSDVQPGESLPVMVWIHGGSYVTGAGDIPIQDPTALVAEQRVIVVAVTYRLGLLGYLGTPSGRPANLGLLDQLAAFRWVQRNIAAFGGDPRRVTAFGQSAGGDAVAHAMATPGAEQLFSRAIIQSAPLGILRGRRLMSASMGEAAESLSAGTSIVDLLAAQPVVARRTDGYGLRGAMAYGTQYGFEPLPPESEIDGAWDAVAPSIPVLIGHTAEEARLFIPSFPGLSDWIRKPLIGGLILRLASWLLTSSVYGASSLAFAKRHRRAGGIAHHYVLAYAAPGNDFGAAHTMDLPFLFGNREIWADATLLTGASWDDLERGAREVRRVWGDFARGADLGRAGEVAGILSYRKV